MQLGMSKCQDIVQSEVPPAAQQYPTSAATPTFHNPRATFTSRKSGIPQPAGLVSPTPSYRTSNLYTPTPASRTIPRTPAGSSAIPDRPCWNGCTNLNDMPTYITRKSSALAAARTPRPSSTIPFPSLFRRDTSASPAPGDLRSVSRVSTHMGSRSPVRNVSSPTPARSSLLDPPPYSRLHRQSCMSNTPRCRQSFAGMGSSFSRSVSGAPDVFESPSKSTRPEISLGHSSRRASLRPLPKRADKDKLAAGHTHTVATSQQPRFLISV